MTPDSDVFHKPYMMTHTTALRLRHPHLPQCRFCKYPDDPCYPNNYIDPVKATLSLSQGNTGQQRHQQTQDLGSSQHAARPSRRHTHADLAQRDLGNDATRWTQPSTTAAHPPTEPATAGAETPLTPWTPPWTTADGAPPTNFALDCDTSVEHGEPLRAGAASASMADPIHLRT